MLNEVNEVSVLNPILREFGVQRLLGVPVFGEDGLLGVLHVGAFAARTFTPRTSRRLEGAAAEIGQRLSERTEDDAHLAALALQRSLLPAHRRRIEGLDVAVRYLPAEGDLGGDWYDIFTLPSGKVGFVLGDVEGHGLRAAIVMGRLRSALRAYALDHDDPAEVLHRLDRKLCYFENDISATVVYAVTEPPFDLVTHLQRRPPGAVDRPARATVRRDRPGVGGPAPRPRPGAAAATASRSRFPPGTALAFYTDGLVERRGGHGWVDGPGRRAPRSRTTRVRRRRQRRDGREPHHRRGPR